VVLNCAPASSSEFSFSFSRTLLSAQFRLNYNRPAVTKEASLSPDPAIPPDADMLVSPPNLPRELSELSPNTKNWTRSSGSKGNVHCEFGKFVPTFLTTYRWPEGLMLRWLILRIISFI
jgi:hypothetical protein